jgi:hypothetical protein
MPDLHHLGYWVDDLAAAQARWGSELGVGPFEVIEHVPVVVELDQVHAIDDRLAAAYGVVPGAVSHVSWVVPDVQEESARLAGLGCALINAARSGPITVAWHDGGTLFPHPIEVHQRNDVIAGHARPAVRAPGRRGRLTCRPR